MTLLRRKITVSFFILATWSCPNLAMAGANRRQAPPDQRAVDTVADREQTSRRLTVEAESYISRNQYPEAIELLGEAVAYDSDNGVALAELALAYLKHGDLEFAEFYLDLAHRTVQQENPPPRLYEVLGDICLERNRAQDAVEAWEKAWSLGGGKKSLEEKIRRARTEWAFSHGQKYFASDRVEIFFDASIPGAQVESIAGFLDRCEGDLERFFATSLTARPVVILYSGRRYFSFVDIPDWVGGFYDGKIRIPFDPQGVDSAALRSLLTHEMAHAFIVFCSRGRAPSWLEEGLAQFVEGKRITVQEARVARSGTSVVQLDDLDALLQQRRDREIARRGYLLSLSLVQYIADRRGVGALICLLKDLGSGQRFDSAFRASLESGPTELAETWRASLQS